MKAIVLTRYGSLDALEFRDVDRPHPEEEEVLIRVHATSVNDWDASLALGSPAYIRLIHGWLKPNVAIPGCDVAGVVESVGAGVARFRPGDAVYGDLHGCGFGTYAEFVCAHASALEAKPPNLSFEQAAAVPHAATLAWQALYDYGRLQSGEKLLINGAGGGVGPIALQLAKLHDCEVTGVDSGEKLPMLESAGFDHVFDYRRLDFTRTGNRYDLILDVKTDRSPIAYARALEANGRYVTVGGSPTRLLQHLVLGRWTGGRKGKSMRIVALKANRGLAEMAELLNSSKILPIVDGPYPLADARKAIRRFADGAQQGRIVLDCSAS